MDGGRGGGGSLRWVLVYFEMGATCLIGQYRCLLGFIDFDGKKEDIWAQGSKAFPYIKLPT